MLSNARTFGSSKEYNSPVLAKLHVLTVYRKAWAMLTENFPLGLSEADRPTFKHCVEAFRRCEELLLEVTGRKTKLSSAAAHPIIKALHKATQEHWS